MGFTFWLLIAIGAVVAWLVLVPVFTLIGKFGYKCWKKLDNVLNKEYGNKDEKEEEEK